jgi:hypothetical protein
MALAGPTKIMDAVAGPPRPHSELFPLLWDQLLSRLRRAFCGAGSASQKYAPASARAKARFKPSAFAAASPPLPRAVLPAGNRKEERADGLRLTPFASAPKEPEGGGVRRRIRGWRPGLNPDRPAQPAGRTPQYRGSACRPGPVCRRTTFAPSSVASSRLPIGKGPGFLWRGPWRGERSPDLASRRALPPRRRPSACSPAPWRRRQAGGSQDSQCSYIDKGMGPADTPFIVWQGS